MLLGQPTKALGEFEDVADDVWRVEVSSSPVSTDPTESSQFEDSAGRSAISAVVLMIVTATLFSTGGAVIKAISASAWEVAGARSLVAASFIALLAPSARRLWSGPVLRIGLAYALTLTLFVHANKLTTASHAVFLQATAPFYVVLLSPRLLGERWSKTERRGALLWLAALACLLLGNETAQETAPAPLLGGGLALLSAVTYGLLVIGLRHRALRSDRTPGVRNDALAGVVCGNVLAALFCFAWAFGIDGVVPLAASPLQDLLLVAYLGLFQVGLAYILLVRATASLSAISVSFLLLLEPLLSPLWSYLWHQERSSTWVLLGGAFAILATIRGFASRTHSRADGPG